MCARALKRCRNDGPRAIAENHPMQEFSSATPTKARSWQIRPLKSADVASLMQVQQRCYGEAYLESAEIYRMRVASAAQCSLVAVQSGKVLAYLAAYHSSLGQVTPLHGTFERTDRPDTLYLHDMAVDPAHTGLGIASDLLRAVWSQARNLGPRYAALVSVQNSQTYWAAKGFSVHTDLDATHASYLRSYGEDACYMTRMFTASE